MHSRRARKEPREGHVLFLAVVVLLSVVTWRYLPEIRSAVIEGERYR
jgi:type II secretory pathway component PulM